MLLMDAQIMPRKEHRPQAISNASDIASEILMRADRDIAFVPRLIDESQYLLTRHFTTFIEGQLGKRGMDYDGYPLLRVFIETHARELTEFVVQGVGLSHQLGLQTIERLAGDPMHLLRADIWDTLRSYVESAETHFDSGAGGLQALIAEAAALRPDAPGSNEGGVQ